MKRRDACRANEELWDQVECRGYDLNSSLVAKTVDEPFVKSGELLVFSEPHHHVPQA